MLRRLIALTVLMLGVVGVAAFAATAGPGKGAKELSKINHIVVIYEENHSFDNLYGGWEGVNGLANADPAHTTQVAQNGAAYGCLQQVDVNIVAQSGACTLPNTYFGLDAFLHPADTTCPQPFHEFDKSNGWLNGTGTPGGCSRDIVHRYYSEIYQLDGGKQDRYVTGSDAVGTVMGVYDTKSLPIYRYLHQKDHPRYAILDDFFQAAFGGSFLNHQWLIAAATPVYPGAVNDGSSNDRHSVVDAAGMPTPEPLYTPLSPVVDRELTVSCNPAPGRGATPPGLGLICGDYAVNTMKPFARPFGFFSRALPAQTAQTIGDRLSANGVDWAWYSGGWSNAAGEVGAPGWTNGNGGPNPAAPVCADPNVTHDGTANYPFCADRLFQFHHQPFAFFANYGPGAAGRGHLQDEVAFEQLAAGSAKDCRLKAVSFVKPIGEENEHPGYASEPNGSDHLVGLLKAIEGSKCAKDTLVVVTYDEFGGQWDHVSPPGQGNNNGPHDVWGPGSRVPALVLSPHLHGDFVVDSTEHDTTSILATIEHRFGLAALSSRDAAVPDLSSVYTAHKAGGGPDDPGDDG
jgi:acid phosphatase